VQMLELSKQKYYVSANCELKMQDLLKGH